MKFNNVKLVQAAPTEFTKGNFEHGHSEEQSFGKEQSGNQSSQRHTEDKDTERRIIPRGERNEQSGICQ